MWDIALITVSSPDFLWISCPFHLHSIQLRSPQPVTLHFLGNSHSEQWYRSKCAPSLHLLGLLQDEGLIFWFPFKTIGHAKVDESCALVLFRIQIWRPPRRRCPSRLRPNSGSTTPYSQRSLNLRFHMMFKHILTTLLLFCAVKFRFSMLDDSA